jgi:hypothetical protein
MSTTFSKIPKYQISRLSSPVAICEEMDRQAGTYTDMAKQIGAFCHFSLSMHLKMEPQWDSTPVIYGLQKRL